MRLLRSSDDGVQNNAAAVLSVLAKGSNERSAAIAAVGGIPALVCLLGSSDDDIQYNAEAALQALADGSPERTAAIVAAGGSSALGNSQPEPASLERSSGSAAEAPPARCAVQLPPRACAAPGCTVRTRLKRCSGCHAVRYCSMECARAHWREHRGECRRMQAEYEAGGLAF